MITSLSVTQVNIPPGVIDLGIGDPPLALLPLDLIRRAAKACLAPNDPSILQYGAEQGNGYFRLALAEFLSRGYGFPVNPQDLFVTSGVSSGLDLICSLFTLPGDTVFVEEPTYFLALRIFADHDLRLVPIQTDADGLVVDSLEDKLAEHHPKFIYVIPTFQNPTGHTLTEERRARLVDLCQKHDVLLLADEVYHFLSYTRRPPKPFAARTNADHVISLSSFSKILAPGLRLGWIQAYPEIIRRLITCGLLDSGGGMNPFTSAIVRGVLESGDQERNIAKLTTTYTARLSAMDAALRRHLPNAEYTVPHGGYFFWVRLPGEVDTSVLQRKAQAFRVGFRPGVRFSCQGGLREYMRLSFVFYEAGEIEEGLKRLKQCIDGQ
jgi:2-aminoadipate transaminase